MSTFGKLSKIRRGSLSIELLAAVAVLHFASMALILALSRYLQTDFFDSLTFQADDGWCDLALGEGVGIHCFGDYSVVLTALGYGNPWQNEGYDLNYGGPGVLLFLPAKYVEFLAGDFDAGLFAYLLAMIFALSVPLLIIARRLFITKGGLLPLSIGAIISGPLSLTSIIALDRGNSVGFALPFLAWFAWAYVNGKYTQVSFAAGAALLIRPQFGLLLFALLAARKFKLFFVTLGVSLTSYVLSYSLFFDYFPANIMQSVNNILQFPGDVGASVRPPNVSLARGIYFLLNGHGDWFAPEVLGFSIILVLLFLLLVFPRSFRRADAAFAFLVLASLAAPVSYAYYLLFAQVAVFGVLWDYSHRTRLEECPSSHSPSVAWAPGLVLSLVALPFLTPPGSTLDFAPVGWLLSLAIIAFQGVSEVTKLLKEDRPSVTRASKKS